MIPNYICRSYRSGNSTFLSNIRQIIGNVYLGGF